MMNPLWLSQQVKTFFILAIAQVALLRAQLTDAGQGWPVYAHDSQHSCLSSVASQKPQFIRWSTPVDLNPQYSGNDLFIHYGSPAITADNTVIVPVKTRASGSKRTAAVMACCYGRFIRIFPYLRTMASGHQFAELR